MLVKYIVYVGQLLYVGVTAGRMLLNIYGLNEYLQHLLWFASCIWAADRSW